MSFSDKISWVGGMMGLFTGFSVISAIEILYWLWFKVVFHKHDTEVEPAADNNSKEIEDIKNQNDAKFTELKVSTTIIL